MLPAEYGARLCNMQSMPEYHLALASKMGDYEYLSSIYAVARRFPRLQEAVKPLREAPAISRDERVFVERFSRYCDLVTRFPIR